MLTLGFFLTKIFHPNVSLEGEICVNTLKKDWNPKEWNISNIFAVVKCLLINPFPESSLNDDAGRLFMENYDEFCWMAKLMTSIHASKKLVKVHVSDPDVEMKPVSPLKWKHEEKEDAKPKFGSTREELKFEEDGEPLQSLNNNMCFNNSPAKSWDAYIGEGENEEEEKRVSPAKFGGFG